ncbi:MAG: SDR family NAD(P)-dependent oxidoreductase [Gammaproteobacteria bacterium]|nr:SDR family NAD(P)-dependent oxidoreductase [Gammaproteobacteria bacterium]
MDKNLKDFQPPQEYLQDRIILITGASRGIGKAVALECARLGATILLVAKDLKRLESTYDEIIALNAPQPAILNIDLEAAVADDFQIIAESIDKEYGRLDGLLHNAGRVGGLTPLQNIELETWSKLITLHLHAPFLLSRACIPLLKNSKDPSILFTIDETNKAYWGAYGVSKYGQVGLLKILADELDGDQKIRVNGVHPGIVRTDLRTHNYPGINPNEFPAPETVTSPFIYFLGASSKGTSSKIYHI